MRVNANQGKVNKNEDPENAHVVTQEGTEHLGLSAEPRQSQHGIHAFS